LISKGFRTFNHAEVEQTPYPAMKKKRKKQRITLDIFPFTGYLETQGCQSLIWVSSCLQLLFFPHENGGEVPSFEAKSRVFVPFLA